MSASDALTMAVMRALSASLTCMVLPSRALTVEHRAVDFSIVPRTRTRRRCARQRRKSSALRKAALVVVFISCSPRDYRFSARRRNRRRDIRRFQRAVGSFFAPAMKIFSAGLRSAARLLASRDFGARRHDDGLLAVLVFHDQLLTVDAGDLRCRRWHSSSCCRARSPKAGKPSPTPRKASGKMMIDDGLLAAVRLRHGGDGNVRVRLDVGERRLHDLVATGALSASFTFIVGAVARLHRSASGRRRFRWWRARAPSAGAWAAANEAASRTRKGARAHHPSCHHRHNISSQHVRSRRGGRRGGWVLKPRDRLRYSGALAGGSQDRPRPGPAVPRLLAGFLPNHSCKTAHRLMQQHAEPVGGAQASAFAASISGVTSGT